MSCNEFKKLIPRSLDGELGKADTRALETHLADCGGCAELHAAEKRLKALFRPVAVDPPPGLRPRILSALTAEAGARRAGRVLSLFRRTAVAALLFLTISAAFTFFQLDTLTAGNRDGDVHYEDLFSAQPPEQALEILLETTSPGEALRRQKQGGK
jgi:anti-sigma factor RsiW